jgi:hypothetical protein
VPVSYAGAKRTRVGGAGGVVSIVTVNALDVELTFPAASVAFAVMV